MTVKIKHIVLIIYIFLNISATIHSQPVTPQQRGTLYSFSFNHIYFEADASFGGRISSFSLNGRQLLFIKRNGPEDILWGSTYWESPQSTWGWPPSPVLDKEPYKVCIENDKIVMQSFKDTITGLVFRKVFYADASSDFVTIEYTIFNKGDKTISRSGWEVSRVPAGGITFFPAGDGIVTGDGEKEVSTFSRKVKTQNGIRWYAYSHNDPPESKFYSDGNEGWLAHLNESGLLFVKQFEDKPVGNFAQNEKEIEFWLESDESYMEIENQSEYKELVPGDSLLYTVKWYLFELPHHIEGKAENENLVNFLRTYLKKE